MSLGMDFGELQLPLLVVELVLLAFTLLMIVITRGEFRARSELMAHVSSATDAITRQEYFATVIDTIQAAERHVLATVTATSPTPEESAIVSMIVDSLSKASARGVKVRYMVPHSPDRLPMARRVQARGSGAEVPSRPRRERRKVHGRGRQDGDHRVPDRTGGDQPTKRGHNVTSESVAHLFSEKFESQWSSPEAKTYSQYLLELVASARHTTPNVSARVIANNLKVDKEDIEYVDAIVSDSLAKAAT
jgi:hypothetical protein